MSNLKFNNSETRVKCFGVDSSNNPIASKNVEVLFYNSEDDFAIKLLTTSNDEVIRDLTTYIPGYKKNANVYDLIAHAQAHAVKRAKQLEQHHAELGRKKNSMECNPSTDAYKVLEIR